MVRLVSCQETRRVPPKTTHFPLPRSIRHGQCLALHFQRSGLRVKLARLGVLLDNPEIEAAPPSISYKPLRYRDKESPPDSLPSAMRDHVEIVQERTIYRVLIWKHTGEAGQIGPCFREENEEGLLRPL